MSSSSIRAGALLASSASDSALGSGSDFPYSSGKSDLLMPPGDDESSLLFSDGYNTTPVFHYLLNASNATAVTADLRHSVPVTVLLSFLAAVVAIATIFGNLLVLYAFFVDRTLHQPGNYLIVSLALADLLIGIFSMPLYTMYLLLDETWPLGWVACDLWLSLDYTVCLVSQYTVFYITLDRFLVVKFTATYRIWLTNKRAKLIVAGIWTGSWLLFFPSITGWQFFVGKRTVPSTQCWAQFMENPLFNTVLVILYYWVTLVVISVLYGFIYQKAWEMETRRKGEHKRAQMVHRQLAQAALGGMGRPENALPRSHSRALSETDCEDDNVSSTSTQSGRKATPADRMRAWSSGPRSAGPDTGNNTSDSKKTDDESDGSAASDGPRKSTGFARPRMKKKLSVYQEACENEPLVDVNKPSENKAPEVVTIVPKQNPSFLTVVDPEEQPSMKRSHSDLEPILTAAGLLRVPVDELIGIEFIDDDRTAEKPLPVPPHPPRVPSASIHEPTANFPPNTIYRLRLDPSMDTKSATFDNIKSARTDMSVKQRIDRLLSRTKRGLSDSVGKSYRLFSRKAEPSAIGDITDSTGMYNSSSNVYNKFAIVAANHNNNNSGTSTSHQQQQQHPHRHRHRPKTMQTAKRLAKLKESKDKMVKKKAGDINKSRAHKALRMISFILGVFVITWTPYHILAIMKGFCSACVNDTLYAISYWFCYLNSPINPICYAVANKHFKRAFIKILRGNFKRNY